MFCSSSSAARRGWVSLAGSFWVKATPNSGSPLLAMPAIPQIQHRHSGYKSGPDPRIQLPQLPKQLDGKFVRGQMYTHQDSLPKLPVPPLEQTLRKYVKGIQHLVSREEFERTKKIVAEFGRPGGVGEELQKKLLQRAEAKESWLLDWWNDVAYLAFREPVIVHSNPAVGFPPQDHGDRETFARMVARIMIGMTKWNLLILNHALPPDMYRKRAMCMVQYDVYSKMRIPAEGADFLRKTPLAQSRHYIIMRNGHFYKLDVIYQCPDGSFALVPPTHIVKQLLSILETAPETCEHPVGVLTTENRDSWFETRKKLLLDPINRSTLEAIETAQGVISLDQAIPSEDGNTKPNLKYWDEHKTMLANRYLHGNGTKQHGCNRWLDSSIQLLVGEDGGVGSNLEHSAADGVCAMTVNLFSLDLQEMYDVLTDTSPVPETSLQPFQPLQWNISQPVARDIQVAKEKLDKLSGDVDLNVFTFNAYGKGFPKAMKLSPDGFIQNAILLTYYRMYGRLAAMYESASTRMFKLGRTDTIRNTTDEANTFVRAMDDPNASSVVKAKALEAAVKAHSQATVEAIEGQAFDRHLLGLRMIAKESGMDMPDIFTDASYGKSLHFCLSTSQVGIPNYEMFLCFGAVVPDGYGVCYNPQENQIILSVSCFHSCPDTDSILFLKKISENLVEMRDVLVDAKGVSAKL